MMSLRQTTTCHLPNVRFVESHNNGDSRTNIKQRPHEPEMNYNLARQRKTAQSSTLTGAHESWRAVDGNLDSNMTHGSCMHTLSKAGNWWKVFLDAVYEIQAVVITNGAACCGESFFSSTCIFMLP